MRTWTIAVLFLFGCALTGCGPKEEKDLYSASKPLDKMSDEEWCAFYARYLTNPQITPKAKEIDLQRMRARGCPMAG